MYERQQFAHSLLPYLVLAAVNANIHAAGACSIYKVVNESHVVAVRAPQVLSLNVQPAKGGEGEE